MVLMSSHSMAMLEISFADKGEGDSEDETSSIYYLEREEDAHSAAGYFYTGDSVSSGSADYDSPFAHAGGSAPETRHWCGCCLKAFDAADVEQKKVVKKSAACNDAQLLEGSGVVWRQWDPFFVTHSEPVTGIRHFYHFYFDSQQPEVSAMKTTTEGPKTELNLLKKTKKIL